MTYLADYCTLTQLKAQLRITDTDDDLALGVVITAASRAVDLFCNQRFGDTGSAIARVYTWRGDFVDRRPMLPTDPFSTVSGLIVKVDPSNDYTYPVTLTINTDFDTYPLNAAADVVPYTGIVLRLNSQQYFPVYRAGVQITARYGWTAVPSAVEVATMIQAARFFVRRYSPYGVAGSPDLGSETRLLAKLDPDVQTSLREYVRWWGAARST